MGEIFRELMAEAEAKRPSLSEDRIVELYQAWDKRHGSTFDQLMQTCFTEGHAAAQSRINALLEEVEGKNRALAMALGLLADTRHKSLLTEKMADWIMSNLPTEEASFADVIDASLSAGRSGSGDGGMG